MATRAVQVTQRSMLLPPMRAWQAEVVTVAGDILVQQNRDHLYICAPTASGKSRAIFEIGETLPVDGARIILIGLTQIIDQFRKGFAEEFGCYADNDRPKGWYISPTGKNLYIGTWQGLSQMATKLGEHTNAPWNTGILFFDEAHVGGSNSGRKKGDEDFDKQSSFQKIFNVFKPKKKIYVSATTQTVDEKIFGKKKDHFYRYSMTQAFQDGVLNPVDMVEVHTGINLKIKKIETQFGRNIEDLEELSDADLAGLAKQMDDKSVSLGKDAVDGLRWLIRARHREMMQLYAANHLGEQAIFYCPNIDDALRASLEFNQFMNSGRIRQKCRAANVWTPRSHDYHSDSDNAKEILSGFLAGEVKVLFVVGMLQEGFNMPSLALGFDCRFHNTWNTSKVSRLIQRIGRLMRKNNGKGRSRYYFARDISDYYQQTAPLNPDINEDDPIEVSDDYLIEQAGRNVAILNAHLEGATEFDSQKMWEHDDITVSGSSVEEIETFPDAFDDSNDVGVDEISTSKIKSITTPLIYEAIDAFGYSVKRSFDFCSLMGGNSADENKKTLLAMAKSGADKPRKSDQLYGAWLYHTTGKHCDVVFTNQIKAIRPDWLNIINTADLNREELLKMAQSGADKPKPSDQLYGAWHAYTKGRWRNNDFTNQIKAIRPEWFINTADLNREELLDLAKSGADKPKPSDQLYGAWHAYTKGRWRNNDFTNQIKAIRPEWFNIINTADLNKAKLLDLAKSGADKPRKSDRLYTALINYTTPKGENRDEVFTNQIKAIRPEWFNIINTADLNKAKLLDLAKSGADKPKPSDQLYEAWLRYTAPKSKIRDESFINNIKAIRPEWIKK